MGLRNRILNLPFMVAAVLTLLWRNVPGVQELTRLLHKEGFLWIEATQVTQKALFQRFLTFPDLLFEKLFKELVSHLQQQWTCRQKRPLPDSVNLALSRFEKVWIVDGSTKDGFISET